jgi:hypothetical protein
MATNVDPLRLRKVMGRHDWLAPTPFGPDGWAMLHRSQDHTIVTSVSDWDDGVEYVHASFATTHRVPTYHELAQLHRAVFDGYAYQVFAPPSQHVNIHEFALHLWGRLDGKPCMPEFGMEGTI